MNGVLGVLVAVSVGLAPVPPEPTPDPLAWGYLGVRVDAGSLRLSGVEPGTPAAKAGLQSGDEIVRIGDLAPTTFQEVAEHISSFRPGSLLRVVVRRDGEERSYVVRLGVRPGELGIPPVRGRVVPLPDPPDE